MYEYYDSDEDVYWGPVTLKEKKRDVLRKIDPKFIKNRSSIGSNPTFIADRSERFKELTSTEIQIPHNKPPIMSNFIDKVAKVLDITAPTDEGSYFTAKDYVISSEKEDMEDTEKERSATYHTLNSSGCDKNCILYSGTSSEHSKQTHNSSVDSSISISDVVDISSDFEESSLDQSLNRNDSLIKHEESLENDLSEPAPKESFLENQICYLGNSLEIIEEVDENSTHIDSNPIVKPPEDLPEIKEHSDSTDEESFKFNDTLEEMEQFLQEGINYAMSSNEKEQIPQMDRSEIPHLSPNAPYAPNLKINNSVSPTTPKLLPPTTEKLTMKTVMKQKQIKKSVTPSPKPLLKDRFKNIQSPIGIYIKNSGKSPLITKVTPSKSCGKENNVGFGQGSLPKASGHAPTPFPSVLYKSAKKKVIHNEEFKLPHSVDTLVPIKASVAYHRSKTGNTKLEKDLVDGDLTLRSNSSLNSTQDTSVLHRKNVFI